MNDSKTPSIQKLHNPAKRPLSLSILLIFALLLGISLTIGLGLAVRNIAIGSWEAATPWELFLFFSTRITAIVFCTVFLVSHKQKIQAARWMGLSLMMLLLIYFAYFALYAPVEQRAINLPRLPYHDPEFGLSIERISAFSIMLYWAWHTSFSKKAKHYFESWARSHGGKEWH